MLATNGGGLTFPDGTTQSTAATSPDLSPYALLAGATFSGNLNVGSMALNAPRTEIQTSTVGATVSLTKGGAQTAVISIGEAFDDKPFVFVSGASGTASIHSGKFFSGGLFDGVEPYARKDGATFTGKVNTLAPTTTNPGLNIGTTSTTTALSNSIAGDIWIGQFQLTFKNGQGSTVWTAGTNVSNVFGSPQIIDTTATTPGLRITQKGTGEAIRVEDSTTPDSTSFIVGADGRVAIGANTAAASIYTFYVNGVSELNGQLLIKEGFTMSFGSRSFTIENDPTTNAISGNLTASDYPTEIFLKIGGINYAIPARQI